MININEIGLHQDVDTIWKYQFTIVDVNGDLVADSSLVVRETTPAGVIVDHTLISGGTIVTATTPAGTYNIDATVDEKGEWLFRIISSFGDTHTILVPVFN